MLLRIDHETRLDYTQPVTESVMEVRMAPVSTEDQTVLGYRLRIVPQLSTTAYRDGFGNRVDLFNMLAPHREIVINATSFVRVHRRPGRQTLAQVPWPTEPPSVDTLEYLASTSLVDRSPEVVAFCDSLPTPSGSLADVVEQLIQAVRGRLKYEKKVTDANTPVSEALRLGGGVCQDFAHLFIAAARSIRLPARYVSGYVHQPGELATHAWCQVWAGSTLGWIDVDPTHGKWCENDHVVTAIGRDFYDVPPNRGVWKGLADETISVTVNVTPVERMPADFHPLGIPAWSATAPGRPERPGLSQNRVYRQQQSQQQQQPPHTQQP